MRSFIKCNCGHRVLAKDVLQTGYYLRLIGPSFVYVKFRCSRCKKLGEQFVRQEEWEDGILSECQAEISAEEKERFDRMGKIDLNECIDAHFTLDHISSVGDLLDAIERTTR
jgi:DNA-directed RNA polymerase subunit RPC12/RpoP